MLLGCCFLLAAAPLLLVQPLLPDGLFQQGQVHPLHASQHARLHQGASVLLVLELPEDNVQGAHLGVEGLHQLGTDKNLVLIGSVLSHQCYSGLDHVIEAQPAKCSQCAPIRNLACTDLPGEVIGPRFGQHHGLTNLDGTAYCSPGAVWWSLLFAGYQPAPRVAVQNTGNNCSTMVSVYLFWASPGPRISSFRPAWSRDGRGGGIQKSVLLSVFPNAPRGNFLTFGAPFPRIRSGASPGQEQGICLPRDRPESRRGHRPLCLGGCHSRAEGPQRKKGRAGRAEAGTCAILRLPHRARPALELRVEVVTATSVGAYFAASWSSP